MANHLKEDLFGLEKNSGNAEGVLARMVMVHRAMTGWTYPGDDQARPDLDQDLAFSKNSQKYSQALQLPEFFMPDGKFDITAFRAFFTLKQMELVAQETFKSRVDGFCNVAFLLDRLDSLNKPKTLGASHDWSKLTTLASFFAMDFEMRGLVPNATPETIKRAGKIAEKMKKFGINFADKTKVHLGLGLTTQDEVDDVLRKTGLYERSQRWNSEN